MSFGIKASISVLIILTLHRCQPVVYGSFCAGDFQLRFPGHQHYNLHETLVPYITSNNPQTQLLQSFKPSLIIQGGRESKKVHFYLKESFKVPQ